MKEFNNAIYGNKAIDFENIGNWVTDRSIRHDLLIPSKEFIPKNVILHDLSSKEKSKGTRGSKVLKIHRYFIYILAFYLTGFEHCLGSIQEW